MLITLPFEDTARPPYTTQQDTLQVFTAAAVLAAFMSVSMLLCAVRTTFLLRRYLSWELRL